MFSLTAPLGLPAPIFWGSVVAWIPIPPSIMIGVLCATMSYAVMVHLFNLREWRADELAAQEADEAATLHVGNPEEVFA